MRKTAQELLPTLHAVLLCPREIGIDVQVHLRIALGLVVIWPPGSLRQVICFSVLPTLCYRLFQVEKSEHRALQQEEAGSAKSPLDFSCRKVLIFNLFSLRTWPMVELEFLC